MKFAIERDQPRSSIPNGLKRHAIEVYYPSPQMMAKSLFASLYFMCMAIHKKYHLSIFLCSDIQNKMYEHHIKILSIF